MPADATLRDYLATIEQSERRRYHDEGEGWTCVPATEAANNMAGLWDEAAHSTGLSERDIALALEASAAENREWFRAVANDEEIDWTGWASDVVRRLPTPEPGPDARQEGEPSCLWCGVPIAEHPLTDACAIAQEAAQPEGEPR